MCYVELHDFRCTRCIDIDSHTDLDLLQPLAALGLLGVVEPLDLDRRLAGARLEQALDAADVGQVWAADGEEDGALAQSQRLVGAARDRLVERLLAAPRAAAHPRPDLVRRQQR